LRIAFLSHYATPHVGGIETAIDGAARELSARGHEVLHIASDADASPRKVLSDTPYCVVRVPALNALEHRLDVPYPLFGKKLASVLLPELRSADVVHAHGFLYQPSLAAMFLSRVASGAGRAARVLTEHVGHVHYESKALDGVESVAIATLGRWALQRAEAIVAYNQRVISELARLVPGRHIDFIGNGVDSQRFRPPEAGERAAIRLGAGWGDGRPIVLFVGRPAAKKGIDLVLSVADLGKDELDVVLVGPGEPEQMAGPNVQVLGPQPQERLAELYRAADVLLLPSRGEGFPLAAQEAMASGLPVVMCSDPSYGSHLEGAGEGVRLVEPNAGELAATVRLLVRSPDTWRAASQAAHRHAQTTYSWSRVADQHEAVYERIRRTREGVHHGDR
jgi:glycosyltransferase involved in cell wall biosynthesis